MAAALARKAAALHCLGAADAARLPGCRDCIVPPSYHKDDMRTLRENLHLSSFSGGSRAVLLIDAHTIAEEVQHLLLKTMEEPPAGVLFLLTGREAGLLPTILSRCAILRYPEPSVSEIAAELQSLGAPMEEALSFAAQGGTLERARRLMQQPALRALRIRS
ncbi:MAG: hypothetical protein Q4C03_07785, partial [bacterium]|nr:hypothetical protein [bacterium]